MNTFLITYEIKPPSLPLQEGIIQESIKSFGYWARPISNVWLIKTYSNKESVYQSIKNSAGPLDVILIMSVNNEWISSNLSNEVVNWMRSGI